MRICELVRRASVVQAKLAKRAEDGIGVVGGHVEGPLPHPRRANLISVDGYWGS